MQNTTGIYEQKKKKTVNSPITDLCLCLKVSSVLWVFRAGEVLQKQACGQTCLNRETQLVAILNSKAEASQQEHICTVYLNGRQTKRKDTLSFLGICCKCYLPFITLPVPQQIFKSETSYSSDCAVFKKKNHGMNLQNNSHIFQGIAACFNPVLLQTTWVL